MRAVRERLAAPIKMEIALRYKLAELGGTVHVRPSSTVEQAARKMAVRLRLHLSARCQPSPSSHSS